MWGLSQMSWGGWIVMSLILLGFWALVVYGIAALFHTDRRLAEPGTGADDPLQILAARFARGEIDADEYQARRRALHSTR
ncbi:hypothetical protein CQZ88_05650 [Rhodococcus sp. ENV425]|nr:hypothetical protein CQZ88_05650 [Rhodococcus sp. ENV425]